MECRDNFCTPDHDEYDPGEHVMHPEPAKVERLLVQKRNVKPANIP